MSKLKPKKPAIFSFFAGAGFLDLGFETTGYDVAFVNEYHEPFLNAYKHSREKMGIAKPRAGYSTEDIQIFTSGEAKKRLSKLVEAEKKEGRLVGFIGGPPCPDFSVAGKQRGRFGDNGKLSAVYAEIIASQKPDFFLFENVRGLWRTKKHREFYEELKAKLHKVGYATTERLINAIEYSAPQDRERIILIGFKKNLLSAGSISKDGKSITEGIFPWKDFILQPREDLFGQPWPETKKFAEDQKFTFPKGVAEELTIEHWFTKNDVLNHPNSQHYFQPRAGLARFKSVDEGDVSRKSYKRLHRWRYSPTACYGNNEVHLHPYKARRLSVAEVLAIQSLPKEFTFPGTMTLTDMFKAVGNGVPYLAAKSIAETIKKFIEKNKK